MASQSDSADSSIARAEPLAKARSRKYAEPTEKARKSAYWRISVESSIVEGRNRTKAKIVHATDFSNNISAQRNVNQQNAMPARIDGIRSISSDVPRLRQTCSAKISSGGWEMAKIGRAHV